MAKKSMKTLLDEMLGKGNSSFLFPKTKAPVSKKTYTNQVDYSKMLGSGNRGMFGQPSVGDAVASTLLDGMIRKIMPLIYPYEKLVSEGIIYVPEDVPEETQIISPGTETEDLSTPDPTDTIQENVIIYDDGVDYGDFNWQDYGDEQSFEFHPGQVSDIRLKENIELVGNSPTGVNIYEFDYKNKNYGNGRYRGVMAQEVPYASSIGLDGYLEVNYDNLDVKFERID